jgi:hypothetical protein
VLGDWRKIARNRVAQKLILKMSRPAWTIELVEEEEEEKKKKKKKKKKN